MFHFFQLAFKLSINNQPNPQGFNKSEIAMVKKTKPKESEPKETQAKKVEEPTNDEQQFQLQKIYLKDISFETPNSPEVFTENWEPDVNVELQTAAKPLTDDVHEVVLTVTVTAKVSEKTAYLAEVHQAGVFTLGGFKENERAHMLGSYCPNILFPYAREAISDLIGKGGFPQMLLAPVNFDVLFAQHVQHQQEKNTTAEESVH
jgi:preprotein translocase subunit SecB